MRSASSHEILAIGVLCVVAAGQAHAQAYFGPERTISVHQQVSGVASADFDQDGHLDLAVVPYDAFVVSVVFGRGDGTFAAGEDWEVGQFPLDVAATDLNEDGSIDMAIANSGSRDVSILLNDGQGSFGSRRDVPIGVRPSAIIVADLDSDAHVDLAVTGSCPDNVTILLGDGFGNVASVEVFPIELTIPGVDGLAASDFNGDGFTDIAVGAYNGVAMWGDGAGGFTLAETSFVGWYPVAADTDGDGLSELVTGFDDTIAVVESDGGEGFSRRWHWEFAGIYPWSFAISDFDEDGFEDIAAACGGPYGGGLAVVLTEDSGSWHWRNLAWSDAENGNSDVVSGDFDGDGHIDAAVTGFALPIAFRQNVTSAWLELLRGNVNAAVGPVTPVLRVNGSPGSGDFEPLQFAINERITITMAAPPSKSRARFVLYAWSWVAREFDPRFSFLTLPFDLGACALPTPLSPDMYPQPVRIANNIGHESLLGVNDWPGAPVRSAPTIVLDLPNGLNHWIDVFLQGFILDTAAPNGVAAVTNGFELLVD